MSAKVIMIQGTGSGVGKSVIVAALCRIFLQDGLKVAPFKAQNMALNSFVTRNGKEIGRAQAVQAEACRIPPTADMNPILIKPSADTMAQVVLKGRPIGNMSAMAYSDHKKRLIGAVRESFHRLASEYEVIVIEGAGSPAEVNLRKGDLVNMAMAKMAGSPVILLGDIDRGGIFASLVGTMALLTKEERAMVSGVIINKFRGDLEILKPGIEFLERKIDRKVLGTIPYFKDIRIPEEDSVPPFKTKPARSPRRDMIKVEVVYLPHISNFTDFDTLESEEDLSLRYITNGESFEDPDVVIIPGTKSTISDLQYLYNAGYAKKIIELAYSGAMIIGICGGYQILGKKILDPLHVESDSGEIKGLGLLDVITSFEGKKRLYQIEGKEFNSDIKIRGYEIHHGETRLLKDCKPVFKITKRLVEDVDDPEGASSPDGQIWGTYIHGIFDNRIFRRAVIDRLRSKKGLRPLEIEGEGLDQNSEYDRLADLVRSNLNMDLLYKILRGRG